MTLFYIVATGTSFRFSSGSKVAVDLDSSRFLRFTKVETTEEETLQT